ncbi:MULTISPECIES: VWA domain-containing protein [unclassified Rhodanobacter]|uniref:vWA domain-containing protein n=1 Tax=unclassified Rhodanobacter TaxID=2621553 RepID=UPI001BE02B00|nr:MULTISPECIES: VWA domain-containing protein [unclassified Rhodanobacter]MBT2145113.1 von Willebrand factor type A domain-containing protein [Rhodanobacter sp. LX-99]MBT2149158.1 von Willebrand factor type A domain-containing protein [Rhodanobacter sp. LX-100]
MNVKALLRTLLLALLVILAGCGASKKPVASMPVTGDAAPAEPMPVKRAAPADKVTNEAATPMPTNLPPPAPPMQPAPAMQRTMASKGMLANAYLARPMAMPPMQPMPGDINTENYTHRDSNPVQLASEQPVSTFGIDVDTGSYTNVRRMLSAGQLPPADAVRAEEFINYFDYGYTPPADREQPFSVTTELAPAPWNAKRQLLLIGIQGYRVPAAKIPASNLVFLIDTSGSMDEPDKLPLLKASLKQLVRELRRQDRVAIVTYAGSAGVALPSTTGDRHATIDAAIDSLGAGGSTNGGAGIELAYAQAEQGFIKGGVNRVILATDGDFNVGTVSEKALKTTIEDHRKSGVALTTLGFGEGNYNDAMAVMLADAGNGSHHYIDSLQEGRRVLVDEMSATLLTIAQDVKIQIEFNPARVQEYRLIGYEKRLLKREDFNNDKVDAGEIGAGANVTAIYEITPKGSDAARIDPLRYGDKSPVKNDGGELAFLRLRYKLPGQSDSRLVEQPIPAQAETRTSERLRYAAAVAAFADALRGGKYLDGYGYTQIAQLASGARGSDADGYRAGFVQLVKLAGGLATHGHDDASDTAAR